MRVKYLTDAFTELKATIKSNPVVMIESPTGSGKTTFMLNFLAKYYRNKRILFISVNRTNCHQIMDGIDKYNEKNKDNFSLTPYIPPQEYLDTTSLDYSEASMAYQTAFYMSLKEGRLKRIALNVLSLHHLQYIDKDDQVTKTREFDIIIIDEVSSLFESLASSHRNTSLDSYLLAFKTLSNLLKETPRVLLLDGYINNNLIREFEGLTGRKVAFIKNEFKPKKCAKIVLVNSITKKNILRSTIPEIQELLNSIKASIKGKKKCVVSSTSRRLIEFLHKQSLNWYMLYHTNTRDRFDARLLESTLVKIVGNDEASKLMLKKNLDRLLLLIYSPAVSTALDITNFEDSDVYHVITNSNVSSITNYQMLNRTRGVKLVNVIVSSPGVTAKRKRIKFSDIFKKNANFQVITSALQQYYLANDYNWERFIESTGTTRLYAPDIISKELLRILRYQYNRYKIDIEKGILFNLKKLLDNESYQYKQAKDYRAVSNNEDLIKSILGDSVSTLKVKDSYNGRVYVLAGQHVYKTYKELGSKLTDEDKLKLYNELFKSKNIYLKRYLSSSNTSKIPLKRESSILYKIDRLVLLVNELRANETNEDKD